MSDQQSIVSPPQDENEIVKDEETVHEEYDEGKIKPEELKEIDEIKDLQAKADSIEFQQNIGFSAGITEEKDIVEDVPDSVVVDEKEDAPAASAPSAPEVTQEATREQSSEVLSEPAKEVSQEPQIEISKEIKSGL